MSKLFYSTVSVRLTRRQQGGKPPCCLRVIIYPLKFLCGGKKGPIYFHLTTTFLPSWI